MMKNCLDTGTIQAFLDGELAPTAASSVSAHIAACDACAAQLATAEEESAVVFSVLEREIDTLVPTQRLWNKINDSIEVERHNAPFWQKTWAFISVALSNPSIAVAAALVVVFGIFTVFFVERNGVNSSGTIANNPTQNVAPVRSDGPVPVAPTIDSGGNTSGTNSKPAYTFASNTVPKRSEKVGDVKRIPNVQQAAYIPGEESYVKTIDTMSQSVDNKKDAVLRPSERISYERDMAVVDDAIAKMKKEVRKNPKNESAKQVLYSSYQNKIDLLNSVSQREELVASLKD